MKRFGLVSQSFTSSNRVILGEIFDKNSNLLQLSKELSYLYPFTIIFKNGKYYYNEQDFEYYRSKYKITRKISVEQEISKKETFHTPLLVDLDTFEPIFKTPLGLKGNFSVSRPIIGIMLSIEEAHFRGNVLDQILLSYPMIILVVGGKCKNNKNSLAMLSYRYLRKKGFPKNRIIKACYDCGVNDCLSIVDLACGGEIKNIIIGCTYECMISLRNKIRDRKVFYRCPY